MHRMVSILAALVMLFALSTVALGASPSEQECDALGGTFDRTQGTVTCTVVDPVGNSENSGGKSQTVDEEESSNGTFNNRPKHEEECQGPGNGGSTAQCP